MYYKYFIYLLSDFCEKYDLSYWTYFKKGFKLLILNPSKPFIIKTIYGFKLFIKPNIDSGLENSLYYHGIYEKGFANFLRKNLKEGDVFIDVGANIGLFTILASKCVGNTGKIFSFEPNPEIFEQLEINVSLNKSKNIELFNFALGNNQSEEKLYPILQVNRGASSLIKPKDSNLSFKVNVKRFDDLFENIIPCYIKIDVEGFEFEVIKGMKNIISSTNPPVLIVEYSQNRESANNSSELIDFILSANHYSLFMFLSGKDRYSCLVKVENYSLLRSHDNIVFIPKNKVLDLQE